MDFLNLDLAAGACAAVHWAQSRHVSLLICKPEDKRKHFKDVEAAPQIQGSCHEFRDDIIANLRISLMLLQKRFI